MLSVNLTIHNKQNILNRVLDGIFKNTSTPFEFIAILDGCTDNSETILLSYLAEQKYKNCIAFKVLYADNIFETRANNIAAKASSGDYICIVQDDCIILEYAYEQRLLLPFKKWTEVFSVSGNCAHNWMYNEQTKGTDAEGWSDLLIHCQHAKKVNTDRNTFYVRDSVNRGPLMLDRQTMHFLGYFDESFEPLSDDDHDLMYRAKSLGRICGYVQIELESRSEWGATRNDDGSTKQWVKDVNHKNAALLYSRHKNIMNTHVIENRLL